MKQKWYLQSKKADFARLAQKFNIDPVTVGLIRNRGIVTDEEFEKYLKGSVEDMYNPHLLKDAESAAKIILKKIDEGKKIRIIGDYDIDGVCSVYILYRTLEIIGAVVDESIPDRIRDGYGISCDMVESAYLEGIDTIITCDNGISARDALKLANDHGMTVIVTDHHEIPFEISNDQIKYILPEAKAIIDPKQNDCNYPFKSLCGAVVAYKLSLILLERFSVSTEFMDDLLSFAALATVGDIMDLVDENRIIVREGLRVIRKTVNVGMRALISASEINPDTIDTYHLGFIIGPCINAAGRLESAELALSLFLESDANKALSKALKLKELNEKRKNMTIIGMEQALKQLGDEVNNLPLIIVYLKDCHESVTGIIAGRLKEQFHKPAFVLTDSNELLKGSARSIESYPMYERLTECGNLFTKFGGHPMAAGFSLKKENYEKMKSFLNEHACLNEDDFIEKVMIDYKMSVSYINEKLISEFELLQPFGNGNSSPVFACSNLSVIDFRKVGEKKNVISISFTNEKGGTIKGVCFRNADELYEVLRKNRKLTFTYAPKINIFAGRRSIQLTILNFLEPDEN